MSIGQNYDLLTDNISIGFGSSEPIQSGCNGVLIGQNCDLLIDAGSLPNIPIGFGDYEPLPTGCNGVLIGQNCDLTDAGSLPGIPIGDEVLIGEFKGPAFEKSLKTGIE